MAAIAITTLADRPEYLEQLYDFADVWPAFMHNDPIGNAFMGQVPVQFPDQCVVATEDGELVAHGRSIPFVFPDENRTELPAGAGIAFCTGGSPTCATAASRTYRARWRS
jgi:hypothetical protein